MGLEADTIALVLGYPVTFLCQTLDEAAMLVIMAKIVYEKRGSIWHKRRAQVGCIASILSGSSLTKETIALNIAPDEPTSRVDTHGGQLAGLCSRIQSH